MSAFGKFIKNTVRPFAGKFIRQFSPVAIMASVIKKVPFVGNLASSAINGVANLVEGKSWGDTSSSSSSSSGGTGGLISKGINKVTDNISRAVNVATGGLSGKVGGFINNITGGGGTSLSKRLLNSTVFNPASGFPNAIANVLFNDGNVNDASNSFNMMPLINTFGEGASTGPTGYNPLIALRD